MDDFKLLVSTAIDIQKSQNQLNSQINKLKTESLKIGIELDDKSAKQAIKQSTQKYSKEIVQYYKDIEKYRDQFNKTNLNGFDSEIKKNEAASKRFSSQLKEQMLTTQKLNSAEQQAYKINEKLASSTEIVSNKADAASKNFNSYIKSLKPQALKEYSSSIKDISDSFTNASESGKQIDLTKANSQLSKFKAQMKEVGLETASFTQIIKDNIGAFTNWYLIGGAVSSVVRDFQEAIKTITEVDTLLTEISKTSNLTGDNLKQLGINAYDAASKYGTTVQAYLQGFQEMSRGTDVGTATGLAELSILAQSSGDMTAQLANDYIIATNAAYGLNNEVSKLNAVLDGQNQITNRNQVSMTDLAEATKVAGSQAAQSGIDIDKMTAAVGTMIASTKQGGDVAGRAFKGILMNLQQVSGEVDGEVFNEDSFKKVEKTLNEVGVSVETVVDGAAKLRDPIEILKELANVYNSLPSDSVEKANIITDLGGKYRGNQLAALLSNWKTYEKMLSDYQGASGSAASEAQKTADSIEGRLNKLTNSWNRTVANIVDSDLLKTFVSIGTGAIDLVDKMNLLQTALIGLGGLGVYKALTSLVPMMKNAATSTLAFGTALNTIKKIEDVNDWMKLGDAITGLSLSQAQAVISTQSFSVATVTAAMTRANFTKEEIASTTATLAMSSAQGVATGTTMSLSGAFSALGAVIAANPIGAAITALTAIVSVASFGINSYNQKQKELMENAKEATTAFDDQTSAMDDYISKIKALREELNSGSLSTAEQASTKEELLAIQGELIDSYGYEKDGLDLVNGSIQSQIDLIRTWNKEKANSYLNENRDSINTATNEMEKTRNYSLSYAISPTFSEVGDLRSIVKQFEDQGIKMTSDKNGIFTISINASADEAYDTINDFMTEVSGLKEEYTDSDVLEGILDISSEQLNKAQKVLDEYQAMYEKSLTAQLFSTEDTKTNPADTFYQYIEAIETLNTALANGIGVDEAKANFEKIGASVDVVLEKYPKFKPIFDDVKNQIVETSTNIADSSKQATESISGLFSNETISKSADDFQSAMLTIQKALSDVSSLSSSDIIDLMQQFPQLSEYGFTGSEGVDALKNALIRLAGNQYDSLDATLKSNQAFKQMYDEAIKASTSIKSITEAMASLSTTNDLIKSVNSDIKEMGSVSEETLSSIASKYPQLESLVAEYNAGIASSGDIISALTKVYEQDTENFRKANNIKLEQSGAFYTEVYNKIPDYIKNLANSYDIDLENYKSVAMAKADINNKLVSALSAAWDKAGGDNLGDVDQQRLEQNILRQPNIVDLFALSDSINSVTADLQTGVNLKIPKSSKDQKKDKTEKESKFSNQIDWAKTSVDKLNSAVSNFEKTMDSSKPYASQITDLTTLISLQNKLATGYTNQAKTYKSEFSDVTKGLDKKYIDKIKNGGTFTIQDFAGKSEGEQEKLYNQITKAQSVYDQWQDALTNAKNTTLDIADNTKKIAEIKLTEQFEKVDNSLKSIDNTISSIDLASSLVDENSIAQITLFQSGLTEATKKSLDLNKAILDLNKQYKNNKEDSTYKERLFSLSSQLDDTASKMKSYQQSIADAMKARYEEQTNLEEKAFKKEQDDAEKIHDSKIDAYKSELEAFKKIVDAQKEANDEDEKALQYKKKITEKVGDISKIQARIIELERAANTGDREAAAEKKRLEEDLAKAQTDLQDTQHDYEVDSKQDALDKAYDSYEDLINGQIDLENKSFDLAKQNAQLEYDTKLANMEKLYKNQEQLIKDAAALTITQFQEAFNSINTTLTGYGLSMSSGLSGALSSSNNGLSSIGSGINLGANTGSSGSSNAIKQILKNGTGTKGDSELNKYIHDNYGSYLTYAEMAKLGKTLDVSGISSADDMSNGTNRNKVLVALKKAGFKGNSSTIDASMIKSTGEDGLALVQHGETILNKVDSGIFKNFVPIMKDFTQQLKLKTPDISSLIVPNSTRNNVTVTFDSLVNVGSVNSDFDIVSVVKSNAPKITEIITKEINSRK